MEVLTASESDDAPMVNADGVKGPYPLFLPSQPNTPEDDIFSTVILRHHWEATAPRERWAHLRPWLASTARSTIAGAQGHLGIRNVRYHLLQIDSYDIAELASGANR